MDSFSQGAEQVVQRLEAGEEAVLAIRHPLLKRVCRATVCRWILKGKIPVVRMGRQYFSTNSLIRETLLAGNLAEPSRNFKAQTANPSDHAAAVARLEARFKGKKTAARKGGAA